MKQLPHKCTRCIEYIDTCVVCHKNGLERQQIEANIVMKNIPIYSDLAGNSSHSHVLGDSQNSGDLEY